MKNNIESKSLEELVREFFELVDKVEQSDEGRHFQPNKLEIASCRVMDGQRIGQIITRVKELVGAPPAPTKKEMFKRNNPEGCEDCFGKGYNGWKKCTTCKGTGSTDPTDPIICPRCRGTGDTQNHERESNDCPVCDRKGRVIVCPTCDGEKCEVCDDNGVLPDPSW